MGRKSNIAVGDRFGDLVIIGNDSNKPRHMLCRCDCGNIKSIHSYSLTSGKTKSCGHNTTGFKNLKNQKFGELTVIEYVGDSKWKCLCSCNKETIVHRKYLLSGEIKSCGHYKKDKEQSIRDEIIGKKFGHLTVLEYIGDKKYRCQCDCENKTIKDVLKHNLENGSTYSCGCIGNGRALEKEFIIDKINKFTLENNKKPNIKELEVIFDIKWNQIREYIKRYGLYEYIDNTYSSVYEIEIANLLNNFIPHDRTILNGEELDFYIPDKKLAIEFNGNYWHSNLHKDKYYHQNKTLACTKQGIQLIHIFEYEWKDLVLKEKIINILNNKIHGAKDRIYARNCKVIEIKSCEAKEFCNKYHLQNYINSSINIGCFHKDELIGLMTFGKPRFNNNYEYELFRMCWKNSIIAVGGLEKLFKYFINNYNPTSILTYSNISKFTGNCYLKLGFKALEKCITEPNYIWVNAYTGEIKTRYQTQKHKLIEQQLGTTNMTETEIMESLNYYKIYDSGNIALEWIK